MSNSYFNGRTKLSNDVSDEFLDWLMDCPYQWHLSYQDDGMLKYTFIINKGE
jgi:hypothetical protein